MKTATGNVNLDKTNYNAMSHHDACFDVGGCSEKGMAIHTVSMCEIIASKNGVELRQITVVEKIHYEIYMDGELLNKFYNLKTAKSMWKDFSC